MRDDGDNPSLSCVQFVAVTYGLTTDYYRHGDTVHVNTETRKLVFIFKQYVISRLEINK